MTLVGLIPPHVRPVGTRSLRLIVPVNPFRGVIVTIDVACVPTLVALGEEADTEKSVTLKVAVVECARLPLVPVRVSV